MTDLFSTMCCVRCAEFEVLSAVANNTEPSVPYQTCSFVLVLDILLDASCEWECHQALICHSRKRTDLQGNEAVTWNTGLDCENWDMK